jgi:hypothetical protein
MKGGSMSDDLNNRGVQDRVLISLEEKHEVVYWTGALGVTEDELVEAVKLVGHSAAKVREHLSRKK